MIIKCLLSAHCTELPPCPIVSLGVTGGHHSQFLGELATCHRKEAAEETPPHLPVPILFFHSCPSHCAHLCLWQKFNVKALEKTLATHVLPHKLVGGRGTGGAFPSSSGSLKPHREERGQLGYADTVISAALPVSGLVLRHTQPPTGIDPCTSSCFIRI